MTDLRYQRPQVALPQLIGISVKCCHIASNVHSNNDKPAIPATSWSSTICWQGTHSKPIERGWQHTTVGQGALQITNDNNPDQMSWAICRQLELYSTFKKAGSVFECNLNARPINRALYCDGKDQHCTVRMFRTECVPVKISDSSLSLDVPHLYGPALPGLSLVIQHIQEALPNKGKLSFKMQCDFSAGWLYGFPSTRDTVQCSCKFPQISQCLSLWLNTFTDDSGAFSTRTSFCRSAAILQVCCRIRWITSCCCKDLDYIAPSKQKQEVRPCRAVTCA